MISTNNSILQTNRERLQTLLICIKLKSVTAERGSGWLVAQNEAVMNEKASQLVRKSGNKPSGSVNTT